MGKRKWLGVGVIVIGLSLVAVTRDPGPPMLSRARDDGPRSFDARFLVAAADADMAGTTYADGDLKPIAGSFDTLNRIEIGDANPRIDAAAAPNSVAAWPGTLDLSPDGAMAYVVESQGAAPPGVVSVKNVHTDLLAGRLLTTLDVRESAPRILRQDDVGTNPGSVHVAADGSFLVIATHDEATPLTFVILEQGVPVELRRAAMVLPGISQPGSHERLTYARLSHDGRRIALHIASTHVVFGEITFDEKQRPDGVRLGSALLAGKYISVGRWSTDDRHYIVADTDWGPAPTDAMRAGLGRLTSIATDALTGRIVSSAVVSYGPEGCEFNAAGDLLVVVNMERTYLPERFPYTIVQRRQRASLSLVSFDSRSGSLTTVDGPVGFDGVLPEDAVFDRDGDLVAVAVFHDRVDAPTSGWIEFFSVDRRHGEPRLAPTGRKITTPRGVHDLAVAY